VQSDCIVPLQAVATVGSWGGIKIEVVRAAPDAIYAGGLCQVILLSKGNCLMGEPWPLYTCFYGVVMQSFQSLVVLLFLVQAGCGAEMLALRQDVCSPLSEHICKSLGQGV
jgi:hypothetical protein